MPIKINNNSLMLSDTQIIFSYFHCSKDVLVELGYKKDKSRSTLCLVVALSFSGLPHPSLFPSLLLFFAGWRADCKTLSLRVSCILDLDHFSQSCGV